MASDYRYAVYFVPGPASRLAGLANNLLGRESENARRLPQPSLPGCPPARLEAITDEPRRYGLHATLKPPFYLAPGCTEGDVVEMAGRFAAAWRPFNLSGLKIKCISSFLALVPDAPKAGNSARERLRALADAALTGFDRLRRPPTAGEIAERAGRSLSPRQLDYLKRWSYPYVLEDYRFHLTLTGHLRDREEAGKIKDIFADYLAESLPLPLAIDSVCICRQQITEGRAEAFSVLERFFFARR
ncbi:MAG: DUF1045 domain-containing protein [Deltaproteobacteria bacterium]|jgi:hypothetical protein|nr:DUF1045 domain-containing protein [Deltaproteobacteria bacterium]